MGVGPKKKPRLLAHARAILYPGTGGESGCGAGFILRLIGSLYHWERTWANELGPALRAARRRSHFALTLSLLKRSAFKLRELGRPKSALGEACTYLLNHWASWRCIATTRSRLDNNLIEKPRSDPLRLGRKTGCSSAIPRPGPLRDHLLHCRLLPAARDRSLRLHQGRPHPSAQDDQIRTNSTTCCFLVEAVVAILRNVTSQS